MLAKTGLERVSDGYLYGYAAWSPLAGGGDCSLATKIAKAGPLRHRHGLPMDLQGSVVRGSEIPPVKGGKSAVSGHQIAGAGADQENWGSRLGHRVGPGRGVARLEAVGEDPGGEKNTKCDAGGTRSVGTYITAAESSATIS